jgi:streptogramin lyase
MNVHGPMNPLGGERSDADVGPILETWMATVAPARAPERLLEESFARTMATGQARAYPWHAIPRRERAPGAGWRTRGAALAGLAAVLTVAVVAGLVFRPSANVGAPTPPPSPSSSLSPAPSSLRPSAQPFPSAIVVPPTDAIPMTGTIALATDGTSVWTFTATGTLARIDPTTNTIAASVTLKPATDAYQALAGDRAGLWVTDWDDNTLRRFDSRTLKAVGSVDMGAKPKGVLVTSEAIWVAVTRGGSVVRVDPKTNLVAATIGVGPAGPSGPNWLARGSGSIWVGIPNNGSVVRINEVTNTIEATIAIPGPASPCGGVAAGSTAIWITSCDGGNLVTQIDPLTNKVVATIDLGRRSYAFALIGDRPWISPLNGQIVRLDPVAHAVDRVVSPGTGFVGGGDVVVAAGSVWVAEDAASRILRLPLDAFGG